jgi:lysozyme
MPANNARPPSKAGGAASILIAAAVLISTAMSSAFEGLITHPNPDPGNPKLMQVCYGDTEVQMRAYTRAECAALLRARQERDYAPQIMRCVPGFADARRRNAFAASIDFSYNEGVATFCRSSIARAFNGHQWATGCERFLVYDGVISGKPIRGAMGVRRMKDGRYYNVFRGLHRRRVAERQLCLSTVR